jgi:hypothetical protein
MEFKSPHDFLRDQFSEWEQWGRGWVTWEEPVHLEPPFKPFLGHSRPRQNFADDGYRPSLLNRVGAWLKSDGTNELATREEEPSSDEREPLYASSPELSTYVLYVPPKRAIRADAASAFLGSLRGVRFPVAFEIVGRADAVAVQVSVREPDETHVLAMLRSHFPDVTPVARDVLRDALNPLPSLFGAAEFGLRDEFMLTIHTPRSFEPDPLLPFFAMADDLEPREMYALQILMEPTKAPWAESILAAVTNDDGSDFFSDVPQLTRLAREKIAHPLFAATLRIGVAGEDGARLRSRLIRLAAGLEQFTSFGTNAFRYLDDEVSYDLSEDFASRQSHRSGMILSLPELAALVHLPSASVETPKLLRTRPGTKRVPDALTSHALILGTNSHAGHDTTVSLPPALRMRHMHVVGASGTGKSTFLLDLLVQSATAGEGIGLIDPHGDLVDEFLLRIPEDRIKDVIILDPSDTEYPVGFNLLAAHSDLEATLLASDLVAVFRRLSTSWGDQMHSVLANAIQAFLASKTGGSLSELRRFLVEPEFREQFLATVDDEETVYYWRKEFPLLVGKPQGPILTRLDTFLRPKPLRQIFTQQENRLDFRDILDGGRIFLAKLAQGAIGEENAALLGSLIVAKFHQAAMSRQELARSSRRNFHLVIDEFQEMVTPSLTPILAGTRKFGLGLTAAHQDLRSLYEADATVANALLANAGTRVVFRVSDEDANRLADGFSAFPASALRSLGVGQAVCRVDRADWDFNLETRMLPALDQDEAVLRRERAIAHSRATYSRRSVPTSRQQTHVSDNPQEDTAELEPGSPAIGLEELLRRLERKPKKPDEEDQP